MIDRITLLLFLSIGLSQQEYNSNDLVQNRMLTQFGKGATVTAIVETITPRAVGNVFQNKFELNLLDGEASLVHVDKETKSVVPLKVTPGTVFKKETEARELTVPGTGVEPSDETQKALLEATAAIRETQQALLMAASVILTDKDATQLAINGDFDLALKDAISSADEKGVIEVNEFVSQHEPGVAVTRGEVVQAVVLASELEADPVEPTTFTDTGLDHNTEYDYSIVSESVVNTSEPSTDNALTKPGVPILLLTGGDNQITLTWQNPDVTGNDGVIDYFDQDDDDDGIPDWDDPELNKPNDSLPAPSVLAVISMLGAAAILMPRRDA